MSTNPLIGYFRRPSIYIQLPSLGKSYPPGSIEIPENNEFPVYPMTAADEITYRTPDALFNGQAVVDVIQSCMPNIKNAWDIPSIDLDKILVAVRLASNGHLFEIDTTCPECNNVDSYNIDLREVLEQVSSSDYEKTLPIGDLTIKFKPLNLREINSNNISQFEEQKLYANLVNAEMSDDEKLRLISDAFKKLSKLTLNAVIDTISYIKTPESIITEREFIAEYIYNCEKDIFKQIKDFAIGLKARTEIKPVKIKCVECEHEYEQPFTMDMSHFFD